MTELTLTLDESALENAQRVAEHRHTTLDCLVEQFFEQLTLDEDPRRQEVLELLEQSFREVSRPVGGQLRADRDEFNDR